MVHRFIHDKSMVLKRNDYHGEEEPEQPSQTKIQNLDDSYRQTRPQQIT